MLKNNSVASFLAAFLILSQEAFADELSAKDAKIMPEVVVVGESLKKAGGVDGYKTGSTRSSTRTETLLLDVPQSISVVTQDQIRDQNISNMEEALRYVPGVNIQQGEGNRDQITIRGNATTADFFIDGARDDVQYYRDFYNIDRVEFLKGPNAMAFGRGGSGGVVNRVSKFADDERRQKIVATGGSFNNRRIEADFGDKVNDKLSLRFNTVYEKSGTFRKYGDLERYGFNPTATLKLSKATNVKVGYEHFKDKRVNDRGIPSFNGAAYKIDPSNSFFGNPNENEVDAEVNSGYAEIGHKFNSKLQLRNYTRYTRTSKFYQNTFASSAVNQAGNFNIAAYNDEQERNNFTNQTDLVQKFNTGSIEHEALLGAEISRQDSSVVRKSGFFNNATTSETLSVNNPISSTSVTYRTAGSDNVNSSKVRVQAAYIQDQIKINKYLQITGGVRYDNFEIELLNKRNGQKFSRVDNLISPRVGIVLKPQDSVSLYTSYSVSYLPSAGDQFNSLSASSETLKPEELQNYEVGAKWDVNPRLNLSAAIYQLDRTNTRANDPNNAGFFVLTGESRTKGIELAASGKITDKWQVIAGYAHQDAVITSTSSAAAAGKRVGLVPRNTFSLWNKYDFTDKWALALGSISQSDQYAAVDNTVRIKGFTRFDAAAYYKINPTYRVQVNVENLFDRGYIQTAHNNNNLQPGSVRALKMSLVMVF